MRFIFTLTLTALVSATLLAQTITIDLPLQDQNFDGTSTPVSTYNVSRIDCGGGTPDFSLYENTSSGSACSGTVGITAEIFVDQDLGSTSLGPFSLGSPVSATLVPDGTHTVRLSAVDGCGGNGILDYTLVIFSEAYNGSPSCIPPPNVAIECSDFMALFPERDLSEATDSELDASFGAAIAQDPCLGGQLTLSQVAAGSTNQCGIGGFVRVFTVTNSDNNTNINPCRQFIQVNLLGICDCPYSDFALTPQEPDFRDGSYHFDWYDCDGTQNFSFSEPISGGCSITPFFRSFSVYLNQDVNQLVGNYSVGETVSPALPEGTHTVLLLEEDGCGDAALEYQLTITRIDGNNLGNIVLTSQEEINLFIRQWSYGSCTDLPGNLTIGDTGSPGFNRSADTPINDLSGFAAMGPFSVGGDLTIGSTSDLTTLAGLEAISAVNGNIQLNGNAVLADISALETAATAGTTTVSLSDNPLLAVCGNPTLCTAADNGASIVLDPNNAACDTPGEFTAACQVLPVELISFNGRSDGKQVKLTWATAREEQNLGFYVERKSEQQSNWTLLTFVPARAQDGNYEITDETPLAGINLYRLRQADVTGAESFSNIISVTLSEGTFFVHPNPARNQVRLGLTPESVDRVRILTAYGQEVFAGARMNTISISDLPVGVYYLEIHVDGFKPRIQRIIIAR